MNVLLVSRSASDLSKYINSNTISIIYDETTRDEIFNQLRKFNFKINRLSLAFHSSDSYFLNKQHFFHEDNISFINDIISEFSPNKLDYLACNTLQMSEWINYYSKLKMKVNASDHYVGNPLYGGDWIIGEDVSHIYFNDSIIHFQGVLSVPINLVITNSGNKNWTSIAFNDAETHYHAVIEPLTINDGIYYSSNGSDYIYNTHVNNFNSQLWSSVISSSSGGFGINNVTVCSKNGYVLTITSATNTTQRNTGKWDACYLTPYVTYGTITMFLLVCGTDTVNINNNIGLGTIIVFDTAIRSWSVDPPVLNYRAAIQSSNHSTIVAIVYDGNIRKTTNLTQNAVTKKYSATWSEISTDTNNNTLTQKWRSIAGSSDLTKMAACVENGYIYISTNSGTSWTPNTTLGSKNWKYIISNSDFTKLVACVYGGYIYSSIDSGLNWYEHSEYGIKNWSCIKASTDFTKFAATVYGGAIYKTATLMSNSVETIVSINKPTTYYLVVATNNSNTVSNLNFEAVRIA